MKILKYKISSPVFFLKRAGKEGVGWEGGWMERRGGGRGGKGWKGGGWERRGEVGEKASSVAPINLFSADTLLSVNFLLFSFNSLLLFPLMAHVTMASRGK